MNPSLVCFGIIIVTLVKKLRRRTEHHVTMRKTSGYEQLLFVCSTQADAVRLAIRGRLGADIHYYIQYLAFQYPHQFGLGKRFQLVMQATQHAKSGTRLVVLHKIGFNPRNFKRLGIEARFANADDVESFVPFIDKNTKAIYLETIGNPRLNIPDFEKFAALAKRQPIKHCT